MVGSPPSQDFKGLEFWRFEVGLRIQKEKTADVCCICELDNWISAQNASSVLRCTSFFLFEKRNIANGFDSEVP